MEFAEPRFIPGDFVIFKFNDDREGMGQVSGAIRRDINWQYYVINPGNAQIPYVIDGSRIKSVYKKDKWEPVED